MATIVHIGDGPFATAIAVRAQTDTQDVRLAATIMGLTHTLTLTPREARQLAIALHAECTALALAKHNAAEVQGL